MIAAAPAVTEKSLREFHTLFRWPRPHDVMLPTGETKQVEFVPCRRRQGFDDLRLCGGGIGLPLFMAG